LLLIIDFLAALAFLAVRLFFPFVSLVSFVSRLFLAALAVKLFG